MNYILLAESRLHINMVENYHNKPTIVFLHDSLGCIETWRGFPKELSEAAGCNHLLYDRLGHGKSDPMAHPRGLNYLEVEANILDRLLNELKLDNVILF